MPVPPLNASRCSLLKDYLPFGLCLLACKRWKAAETTLQKVLTHVPESHHGWLLSLIAKARQAGIQIGSLSVKRRQAVIDLLTQATAFPDCPPEVFVALDVHLEYRDRTVTPGNPRPAAEKEERRQVLERGRDLYPDDHSIGDALVTILLDEPALDPRRAWDILAPRVTSDTGDVCDSVLWHGVRALATLSRIPEALALLERLAQRPSFPAIQSIVARIDLLDRLGQSDKALAAYTTASATITDACRLPLVLQWAWIQWRHDQQDEMHVLLMGLCRQAFVREWYIEDIESAGTNDDFEIIPPWITASTKNIWYTTWYTWYDTQLDSSSHDLQCALGLLMRAYYDVSDHERILIARRTAKHTPNAFVFHRIFEGIQSARWLPELVDAHLTASVLEHADGMSPERSARRLSILAHIIQSKPATNMVWGKRLVLRRTFTHHIQACHDPDVLLAIFLPVYTAMVRPVFIKDDATAEHALVIAHLVQSLPHVSELWLDQAWVAEKLNDRAGASAAYHRVLALVPGQADAQTRLAALEKKTTRAPVVVRPDKRPKTVPGVTATPSWEQQVASWNTLDGFKKQLLRLLSGRAQFASLKELSAVSGIGMHFLPGHLRKLTALGLLSADASGYQVSPALRPVLVAPDLTLHSRSIAPRAGDATRAVFGSLQEQRLYSALLSVFPNYLVFPNMALQVIFAYDEMKTRLDNDTFGYFLRAYVDMCIVSTVNHRPLFAIELDSTYHDTDAAQVRDARKDDIFATGGLRLLRVRADGPLTAEQLRQELHPIIQDLNLGLISPPTHTT